MEPANGILPTAPAPEILVTGDGSSTLRHPLFGECYHSLRGAVAESMHVYVEAGFNCIEGNTVRVFEAGFGSGLNCWLTLLEAERSGRQVEYTAIELYPVPEITLRRLEYWSDERFAAIHHAEWSVWSEISPAMKLKKIEADLCGFDFFTNFDLIYYDAFSFRTQPEMWDGEVLRRAAEALRSGGILVTYAANGETKRALRAAEMEVFRLQGALGKHHMLRAVKQ